MSTGNYKKKISKQICVMGFLVIAFAKNAFANDLELLCLSGEPQKNILIIGDSISKCYSNNVCGYMPKGYAVYRNKNNALDSSSGRRRLDLWVDKRHWDLVYFNFGLHDIIHDRVIRPSCVDSECKLQRTSAESYKANLKSILFSLKKYSSNIVYATTTPFLPDVKGWLRVPGDVQLYNSMALEVMEGQQIIVDDLYSLMIDKLPELQVKEDVHFKPEGCKVLANQVAETILNVFK
jgi:hypothetical protein